MLSRRDAHRVERALAGDRELALRCAVLCGLISISDPVGTGIIASLARPGGHTTGMATMNEDVGAEDA